MQFSHISDPARVAVVHEDASVPSTKVEYVDAAGKTRRKTFKVTSKWGGLYDAQMKALRFLFKESFVVRAPQSGAVRWLTQTKEQYSLCDDFAVAADGVWVGNTGALRRVTPGTCAQLDLPLGELNSARAISAQAGHVLALLEVGAGSMAKGAPYDAPRRSTRVYGVGRIVDEAIEGVLEVRTQVGDNVVVSLRVAPDGRFLGPHADGAALYDGATVIERWAAAPAEYYPPRAALSPDGTQIAVQVGPDIAFAGGRTHRVTAGFDQLLTLEIDNAGVAWVGGLIESQWGLYRVDQDGAVRVCESIHARPAPDSESVIEATAGRIIQRSLDGAVLRQGSVPWLGMAKKGHVVLTDPDTAIVFTDASTLAEVDLTQLDGQ